jgi:hypothetical protein
VLRKQSLLPAGLAIRPMLAHDLGRVMEVDTAAFEPLWRNSLSALTNAYEQASYATVAEVGSNLVGYQLSTGGPWAPTWPGWR